LEADEQTDKRIRSDGVAWGVCEGEEGYFVEESSVSRLSNLDPSDVVALVTPRYSANPDRGELGKWRTYNPLEDAPNLFFRFARLHSSGSAEVLTERILGWVRRYGLLGDPAGSEHYEPLGSDSWGLWGNEIREEPRWWAWDEATKLEHLQNEVMRAAGVLALYEAVLEHDFEKARQCVLEGFPALVLRHRELRDKDPTDKAYQERYFTPCRRELRPGEAEGIARYVDEDFDSDYLRCALNVSTWVVEVMVRLYCYRTLRPVKGGRKPSDIAVGWGFDNLLGAMYLQMHSLMQEGGPRTYCKQCELFISLAPPYPGAKKRPKHKEFCDGNCRQGYHRNKG
jgi:hypothetical protein